MKGEAVRVMDIAGVRVYTEFVSGGNLDVVRERDLPATLREKFNQWAIGRPQPVIEDIPDAVYAWDWQEFCAGENL